MKVILISGKAQSGKDTTASIIRNKLTSDNHRVLITHYADLLKYICQNYFGWNGNKDESGRRMLQYVGTDIIRRQDPSFWVDFVAKMLRFFHENWDYVIIPDCRFPNEITTILDYGFDTVFLRVNRSNFTNSLTEEQQKHPSETALDGMVFDYQIENSGTLKELEATVSRWIKESLYEN